MMVLIRQTRQKEGYSRYGENDKQRGQSGLVESQKAQERKMRLAHP